MKKKQPTVGIVTLYGENNYGNRLQNYAIIHFLKELGYEAETMVVKPELTARQWLKIRIKSLIAGVIALSNTKKYSHIRREHNFRKFTKKHIPTRYVKSKDNKIPSYISDEYDFFVVGSDQVWNPTFGGYEKDFYNMFLQFTEPQKKICFSPSIGISDIPDNWKEKFSEGFDTFPDLSVREQSGVQIIKNLSGKNAELLIDPTLTLTPLEWESVSSKKNKVNGNYILEYFLGEYPQETEMFLDKKSKLCNLKRIKLLDKSDTDVYVSGPGEFVTLINNASLVVTDSFHACVFSILFNKPFFIVKRQDANIDMFSRINTLLELFNIDANNIDFNDEIKIEGDLREKVLMSERNKVLNYFNKCLNERGKKDVY